MHEVWGSSCMWTSIPALAASYGCSDADLKQCLREGAAAFQLQYGGDFVRVPPAFTNACHVSSNDTPDQTLLKLRLCQTTRQQPWVPVIVLEHVAH